MASETGVNGSYELHPLCTLFPRMTGAEFSALVADIKANGLREPIIIHDGMILDGGNRYRACIEAGIKPQTMRFGGGNLVSYVLSANLHRRHMSAGQQAAIVASAQDWAMAQTKGGNGSNQHKVQTGNVTGLHTVADRAAQSGASDKTQRMADKVARENPELSRRVAHGEVSLPKAIEQIEGKRQPEPTSEPEYTELDALRDQVSELQSMLALASMGEVDPAQKDMAASLIADLRAEVKSLEAQLKAVKASRDTYQRESNEMKKQLAMQRKQIEKLTSASVPTTRSNHADTRIKAASA